MSKVAVSRRIIRFHGLNVFGLPWKMLRSTRLLAATSTLSQMCVVICLLSHVCMRNWKAREDGYQFIRIFTLCFINQDEMYFFFSMTWNVTARVSTTWRSLIRSKWIIQLLYYNFLSKTQCPMPLCKRVFWQQWTPQLKSLHRAETQEKLLFRFRQLLWRAKVEWHQRWIANSMYYSLSLFSYTIYTVGAWKCD